MTRVSASQVPSPRCRRRCGGWVLVGDESDDGAYAHLCGGVARSLVSHMIWADPAILLKSFLKLPSTDKMNGREPYDLRAKYKSFRILVIGRANAGKTTLLQRVCNTTKDPCIYDENNKNLVSVHRPEDEFF